LSIRKEEPWMQSVREENTCKEQIQAVSEKWSEIVENL